MAVYLINIALIFVWSFLLLKDRTDKKKKKTYCTIVAIQWILISGLRHKSVGADTSAYGDSFERVKDMSWGTLWDNCMGYLFEGQEVKDPGYNLLVKAFQVFSGEYQLFLFFIAIVFTGLMAWWVYKNSELPEISFLVYSVLFYAFYGITGHRQTLATALVCFIGCELIKEKKFLRFALVAFIAFMLHKSSIVFVAYLLIAHIDISLIYGGAMVLGSTALAIFGKSIYAPIAEALGFTSGTIDYEGGGAETYATVLLAACVIIIGCYGWISSRRKDSKFLYNLVFLTAAATMFVYQNQNFMRVQQYFSLVIMIMIPEVILTFKERTRAMGYMAVAGVLITYLVIQDPQYRFFFA